jgi:hypothetical protein
MHFTSGENTHGTMRELRTELGPGPGEGIEKAVSDVKDPQSEVRNELIKVSSLCGTRCGCSFPTEGYFAL